MVTYAIGSLGKGPNNEFEVEIPDPANEGKTIRVGTKWPSHVNTFCPDVINDAIKTYGGDGLLVPFVASPTKVVNSYPKSSPGPDGKNFEINSVPTREWGGSKKRCSLEFLLSAWTNFLGMNGVTDDETRLSELMISASQKRRASLVPGGEKKARLFADGGLTDGLGVPALVQKKVRKTVAEIWPHIS